MAQRNTQSAPGGSSGMDFLGDNNSDRGALLALLRGFRTPALLFAAFDLGVFDYIPNEGRTAAELGRKLDAPPSNLLHLLNALVSLNILVLWDDRYFIPHGLPQFLRRGPGYIGDFARSLKRENEHWLHAGEIIRGTYAGPPYEGETLDTINVAQTLTNVEFSNRASADSIWPHLEGLIPGVRKAIDVGGGHGYYSELLLQRAPQAQVVIFDLPAAVEYCKVRQALNPNISRMEFVGGDALELSYDREFDLVLMNDLLVYFSRDEKLDLLRRARRALRVGGTLAMVNQRLDRNGCTPARWALFSLRIFVTTGKGYLERDTELVKMAEDAGFAEVQIYPVEDERILLTGKRLTE